MATYTVKSLNQLTDVMIMQIEGVLNKVADRVKARVDQEIETYYAEYSPEILYGMKTFWYDRTNQLRDCCKISPIKKSGNTISIEIYLDVSSLNYSTKGADPWKTLVSADTGSIHGGWEVKYGVATHQIPFEDLGSYTDDNGVRIWSNPMRELLEEGGLKKLFIQYAKEYKINLIAK